jgi:nitroreductase/NAD-dependent dihydropyrimidine dehydrogenase PreA subunit
MGFLIIDESKCKKDGLCVSDCPSGIIRLSNATGFPRMVPKGEAACLVCGHCVAVCPQGALSHALIPTDECTPIKDDLRITEDQAVQFLRSRRSTRLFQEKPVEHDKVRRLIEIARYAPTGGNAQPIEWLVITDRSDLKRISAFTVDWLGRFLEDHPKAAENSPYLPKIVKNFNNSNDTILRDAPVVVVASAPSWAVNGPNDIAIALSYLELMAPAMGLGACWAGLLQKALIGSQELRKDMGLPEKNIHHYPMMLGYPKIKRYYRLPQRKPPKITFV